MTKSGVIIIKNVYNKKIKCQCQGSAWVIIKYRTNYIPERDLVQNTIMFMHYTGWYDAATEILN